MDRNNKCREPLGDLTLQKTSHLPSVAQPGLAERKLKATQVGVESGAEAVREATNSYCKIKSARVLVLTLTLSA